MLIRKRFGFSSLIFDMTVLNIGSKQEKFFDSINSIEGKIHAKLSVITDKIWVVGQKVIRTAVMESIFGKQEGNANMLNNGRNGDDVLERQRTRSGNNVNPRFLGVKRVNRGKSTNRGYMDANDLDNSDGDD